jgi:hypothetical protein
VIIAAEKWTELTGHGLTGRITDVEVVDEFVYFAQGDEIAMRTLHAYNSAGTMKIQQSHGGVTLIFARPQHRRRNA